MLRYARKHHDVIDRFGRFPHRNAMLGRKPTALESGGGRSGALVMALVELGGLFNSFEAGMAKARLAAEGIPASSSAWR